MTEEKVYDIYIDVDGGMVTAVYGDQLPTDCQINFIVRDHDNITAGDPDPIDENYNPEVYYY